MNVQCEQAACYVKLKCSVEKGWHVFKLLLSVRVCVCIWGIFKKPYMSGALKITWSDASGTIMVSVLQLLK